MAEVTRPSFTPSPVSLSNTRLRCDCPSEALSLKHEDTARVPPKTLPALYAQIYQERYGRLGLVSAAARRLLGVKVWERLAVVVGGADTPSRLVQDCMDNNPGGL
jgi:hypothetical protein